MVEFGAGNNAMRVKAEAILFGLALGDALGAPTEFMKLAEIKQQYGQRGIQEPPDPALYTDDTQMTLALTEGLLDAGLDADLDTQMNAVGMRFVWWLNDLENRSRTRYDLYQRCRAVRGGDGLARLRDCHFKWLRLGDARRGDWLSLSA